VDTFSLWCVQQGGRSAHLLSLEIREPDPYFDNCDHSQIESVITQTEERYRRVFNGLIRPPYSLLPNSPAFLDFSPSYHEREKHRLVFCGSAIAEFGVFGCIDFISDYPQYTLTIKGAVPENTREGINRYYYHLLRDNRLIIDDSYADQVELTKFISEFWVGLAFYDFYRFPFFRGFNYYTAPSGKLYQYFNAGVPVIGNQLSGFKIIEESNVGRLIPYLSSLQIKRALDDIEANYYDMAIRAKQLSREFDSNVFLDRFINTYIS